jgi:hypothetical protein
MQAPVTEAMAAVMSAMTPHPAGVFAVALQIDVS